ncbi:ribosome-associated translation inhibitor RaiA (plasmid) [Aneurinibacillus sp. Ricciae_BoGa-3]|uniref:ribosome hibernation-promoting factor, HPF/YfiA family n=1 Tax=Aneurinibacillus sp. Ricciae_BoGa-3 TaxID=3022697 RepID=UPI0023425681|nr:ribosome-associated translation inhibitor RaiA [Aneurinibacillus sp. Ricciae_BoGa-3]WCK57737.1 ribosome-associated translation inhibitor RaiA [Aneurinibacillus sp. Ricciae_BoGa-3]
MQVIITAKNFELTKAIKAYIEEKFEKLEKYADKDKAIRVNVSTQNGFRKAEAIAYLNGAVIKLDETTSDLYIAIDILVDKMKYQLSKTADKLKGQEHRSIRFMSERKVKEPESENEKPKIVKRKQFDLKPMTEEEALLQMEALNHQTFIFFNPDTDTMCLLYKRKDGNYGIIESLY